jgi:hypothetical protein
MKNVRKIVLYVCILLAFIIHEMHNEQIIKSIIDSNQGNKPASSLKIIPFDIPFPPSSPTSPSTKPSGLLNGTYTVN